MKYFIDTEFNERGLLTRKSFFNKYRQINTIELISIGIVAEDGREYYAISKDFDLKAAWNKYDLKKVTCPITGALSDVTKKEYWLRENVLKPIFDE